MWVVGDTQYSLEAYMRILSLDYDPVFGSDATRSTFSSDLSVFDYDVVIWDPEASFVQYNSYSDSYMGLPSLSDHFSSQLKADVQRRRAEFKEFLEAGRSIVVIARPPQSCYVATGEVTYSGTGRNARGTRLVSSFDITSALPISEVKFDKARGDRIQAAGDSPLALLLRKYIGHLEYTATVTIPSSTTIATVTGTARTVASINQFSNGGRLIVLPDAFFDSEEDGSEEIDEVAAAEFQADLLSAIEALSGKVELARPAWADLYSTSSQRVVRTSAAKQQLVVEKAREKLAEFRAEAELADLKDQLYLGTGRQLELRARNVFEQLGGVVTEPEPGRDDWRVEFDKKPAVVEIKGVTKSAAEKHGAQLEKWVAGSFEESGVMPKGILVVNTWRDVPLADRTEPDFPAQMLPYSEGRQHCLITGLELFVISCEIEQDPKKAKFWRERIMSTAGRLAEVPEWRSFIQESSTEVETDSKDD